MKKTGHLLLGALVRTVVLGVLYVVVCITLSISLIGGQYPKITDGMLTQGVAAFFSMVWFCGLAYDLTA